MDSKLLLTKCITLLYRQSQLDFPEDISRDLVMTALDSIKTSDVGVGIATDRELIQGLKDMALEMCRNAPDHDYDVDILLQQLKIVCGHDDRLYDAILHGITKELSESKLKKMVLSYRQALSDYFKWQEAGDILSKAHQEFRFNPGNIKSMPEFISNLILKLDPLQLQTGVKDKAVTSELDIGDERSMMDIFQGVKDLNDNNGLIKTGWQNLNIALDGGLRRGEFVMTPALPHKYKTGFTLSLFKDAATHNVPYMLDIRKKPLLLRLSFEDDLELNLKFLYENLRYAEIGQPVNVGNIPIDEMSGYVRSKLQINGYHIKMLRIDPTQWTYKHIINKLLELEAEGYEIHLLVIDYLNLVPKTGCSNTGASGTDIRDLFRRIRNFCAPKKITCITPHQLSNDAKQLIRGNTPESQLLKEIMWKGYFSDCRSLDQECDLIIYVNNFCLDRQHYLNLVVEKHRGFVPSEDHRYMYYRMPKYKMPVPEDIHGEDTALMKLPTAGMAADPSLFSF